MRTSEDHRRLTTFALRIMGEILGVIAVPAVGFTIVGRWFDAYFDTGPAATVVGLLGGFFLSMIAIALKASGYADRYDQLTSGQERGPPPGDKPPG